ncbi:MAG: TetR/AcrR family transcriptional regulator [Solirubrobacteraceae bacterium]|nr:TetR/AcrR family transcriptional regulator [Solirubrobacteraceae bacterium]
MAAPRKHDTDTILDAARALALEHGPRGLGVAAIAEASGAPVGTLYHRFSDRDGVLAATWLRALRRFQETALSAAEATPGDPVERAVAIGMAALTFSREDPDDARLLIVLRRDDLLDAAPDEAFASELAAINAPLEAMLKELTRALYGRAGRREFERMRRAVVDVSYSAVRAHPADQPRWLAAEVEAAIRALLTVGR